MNSACVGWATSTRRSCHASSSGGIVPCRMSRSDAGSGESFEDEAMASLLSPQAHQQVLTLHRVADGGVDLGDYGVDRGNDGGIHLHRLKSEQLVTLGYPRAYCASD